VPSKSTGPSKIWAGLGPTCSSGSPLGGILSIFLAGSAAIVLLPNQIEVTSLSQVAMPVVVAGGKVALAVLIIGFVAATFGAALETALSAGYTLAQFLGWTWGKFRRPSEASRFHVVVFVAIAGGAAVLFTGVDPILVTELSVVFSAVALPLTYLPILIVANDPGYMGDKTNGKVINMFASVYLVIILVASLSAIPLMIVTGAGQ
jgi:Mn2+/Fe2+ NRAMP family transporter